MKNLYIYIMNIITFIIEIIGLFFSKLNLIEMLNTLCWKFIYLFSILICKYTKEYEPNMYEKLGIKREFWSMITEEELKDYSNVIVKGKFDKIDNNLDKDNMNFINNQYLLNCYIQDNSINNKEQIYALLQDTLIELEKIRKNPILSYYAVTPNHELDNFPQNSDINSEDIDSIYEILQLEKFSNADTIDLILNTSGGYIDHARKLVSLLRENFSTVNIIVPNIAASAGTLISCAADEIIVLTKTNFSLITPSLYGIDTHLLKKMNIFTHFLYYLMDKEYRNNFKIIPYGQAMLSEKNNENYLKEYLNKYSIKEKNFFQKRKKVKKLINKLNTYNEYQSHNTPISPSEFLNDGLNINYAYGDTKSLLEQVDLLNKYIFQHIEVSKLFFCSEYWIEIQGKYKIEDNK